MTNDCTSTVLPAKPSKSIGLEYLRVICMLLVIVNHLVADFNSNPNTSDIFRHFWRINTPMISFGMPMFFFISGILLMRQFHSGKFREVTFFQFVRKKFVRLMIPYIVFTGLTMIWYRFFDIRAIIELNFWHLWFLPTLLWCSILIYLYIDNMKLSGAKGFAANMLLLTICMILPFAGFPKFMALDSMAYWIFTFVSGVLFERYRPVKMSLSGWIVGVVLSVAIYTALWTFLPWEYRGEPTLAYMLSLMVLMGAVCGFFECVHINTTTVAHQLVMFVATFSFSIYNIHYLIIGITARRPILQILDIIHVNDTTPVMLIIAQCALVVLVSLGLCWMYKYCRRKINSPFAN